MKQHTHCFGNLLAALESYQSWIVEQSAALLSKFLLSVWWNEGVTAFPLRRSVDSYNGPNLVLKYDKEKKRLVNIAVDNRSSPFYALRDRHGNAIGVTACDIDGDGREEIYVLNTNNAFSGTVQSVTVMLSLKNKQKKKHTHTGAVCLFCTEAKQEYQ